MAYDQTPELQELAALYALGALAPEDARAFEQALTGSTTLQQNVEMFREVADELAWNAHRMTPPPALKDRLMARLAHESKPVNELEHFTLIRSATLEWRDIGPGVSVKILFFDPAGARVTTLMKMAPGSRYGSHQHAQVEELYVVEGSCVCAGRKLEAGDYLRAPADSIHPDTDSEQGCLALIMTSSKNRPMS